MIKLQIKIDNQDVHQALKRLAAHGKSLRPAIRDIGKYLVRSTKQRFGCSPHPWG